MPNQPPQNLWEVSEQLRYNEPLLDPKDPRYVDTSPGRTLGYERLFRSLGVDSATDTLKVKHPSQYHLFCGHRGSGKSTELRQLKQRLNRKGLFRVIFLDVLEDLDSQQSPIPRRLPRPRTSSVRRASGCRRRHTGQSLPHPVGKLVQRPPARA